MHRSLYVTAFAMGILFMTIGLAVYWYWHQHPCPCKSWRTEEHFFTAEEIAQINSGNVGNIQIISGKQAVSIPFRLEDQFQTITLPTLDSASYHTECVTKANTIERVVPCPTYDSSYTQQWLLSNDTSLRPTETSNLSIGDPIVLEDRLTAPGYDFYHNVPELSTLIKPIPPPNAAQLQSYSQIGTAVQVEVPGGPVGGGRDVAGPGPVTVTPVNR